MPNESTNRGRAQREHYPEQGAPGTVLRGVERVLRGNINVSHGVLRGVLRLRRIDRTGLSRFLSQISDFANIGPNRAEEVTQSRTRQIKD